MTRAEPSRGAAPGADLRPAGLLTTERGRALAVLSGAVLVQWAAMMSVFPALPSISGALRIGPDALGLVMMVSSLLMTVLNVPAGVAADRRGRRPVIVAGLALSALGVLVSALWAAAWPFLAGWVIFGIGRGLFTSPAFTVPADTYGPQERGKAIGILAGAIGAGSVLGYVAGGLALAVATWQTVLMADAVLLVAACALTWFALPETARELHAAPLRNALAQTFAWYRRRVVLLSGVVAGLSFAVGVAATFLVPFSLAGLAASPFVIALVFVPYEVMASAGTVLAGAVSDKVGRRLPLLLALLLVAVALAGLPVAGVTVWSVALVYAFVGLAEGPVISLSTTMVTDDVLKADPRRVGAALGANRLVQGLGPILGPAAGGLLAERAGLGARYWILAAVLAATAVLAAFLPETWAGKEAAR
ncbi:MFS transporter [Nonomuraea bangladeshensis]|uniref:MFS transporter n=1 Tax=Nonomuraea bangladeshensis TaxID=404385 RepID=UPI003C2E9321